MACKSSQARYQTHHGGDQRHSSDNARCLTHVEPPEKSKKAFFFKFLNFFFFFFFWFLGLHPWHMEIPRLGIQSELHLLAYTAVRATWDPSHICDIHHSSPQGQIPDSLRRARYGTHILMDTSHICFHEPWELPRKLF